MTLNYLLSALVFSLLLFHFFISMYATLNSPVLTFFKTYSDSSVDAGFRGRMLDAKVNPLGASSLLNSSSSSEYVDVSSLKDIANGGFSSRHISTNITNRPLRLTSRVIRSFSTQTGDLTFLCIGSDRISVTIDPKINHALNFELNQRANIYDNLCSNVEKPLYKRYIAKEAIAFCTCYISSAEYEGAPKSHHEGRCGGNGRRDVIVKSMG
ncbi:hypothetical protein CR513_25671, partial [Mucuna pruriens]